MFSWFMLLDDADELDDDDADDEHLGNISWLAEELDDAAATAAADWYSSALLKNLDT